MKKKSSVKIPVSNNASVGQMRACWLSAAKRLQRGLSQTHIDSHVSKTQDTFLQG